MTTNTFAHNRIFLVGLPGAGKTTQGQALAAALGWPFVDLDAEIERTVGRSVSAIFEEEGEDFFRVQEAAVLRQVGLRAPLILATGGGDALLPRLARLVARPWASPVARHPARRDRHAAPGDFDSVRWQPTVDGGCGSQLA